jgi:DNA polymerase-3 subunit epsilon/ATP-dependent DNA helicase DinG
MRTWFQTLNHARGAINNLFDAFSQLLEEFLLQGSSGGSGRGKGRSAHGGRNAERTDQPLRLNAQTRNLGAWTNVERAWQQASHRLQTVIDLVHEAERIILTTQRSHHRLDIGTGEDDSVASELAAIAQELVQLKLLGKQAMTLGESDKVYWLRVPSIPPFAQQQMAQQRQFSPSSQPPKTIESPQSPILYAQLVNISAEAKQAIHHSDTSTIFAGVALSVDNSFAYYRGRLGL